MTQQVHEENFVFQILLFHNSYIFINNVGEDEEKSTSICNYHKNILKMYTVGKKLYAFSSCVRREEASLND